MRSQRLRRAARASATLAVVELETRDVPTFYGNQLFPLDNPWNQDISAAPVASNSAAIINRIVNRHGGTAPRLHTDWGNPNDDNLYGIPVNIATSATPKVNVVIPNFGYPDESDHVQVPIPAGAVIEGDGPTGPLPASQRGDSHMLVYDRDANVLYELFQAVRPNETVYPYGGNHPTGQWGAWQISYWDLNTNAFRTIGATSADAAGLPIMTGLVRPDEANPPAEGGVGVIDHAIRMTVQQTRDSFVFPASHAASDLTGNDLPRMGDRFRLKADFVIPSNWSPEAKAIAQAMKTYGLIVADNGSDMYFQGVPSTQWDMENVLQIQSIPVTQFDVVDLTPIVTGLSVTSGSTAGGTSVTITGRNFSGAAGQLHVLFGTTEATSITILSDTQLVAIAPAHATGTVDVRVQSGTMRTDTDGQQVFFGYGTSANTAADNFSFDPNGTDTTPPTVIARTPASGAVGVAATATVTATFSEAVQSSSISLVVRDPSNNTVAGTVSYNATNRTVTFTPTAALSENTTYTATLSGARDAAGNTMTTVSWSFTTELLIAVGEAYTVGTGGGQVTLYNGNGTVQFTAQPFGPHYTGTVRVVTGDVTGDGVDDLVASVPGRVKVVDGATGTVLVTPTLRVPGYSGAISVAVGDLTGDGTADIALGTNQSGPRVQLFRGGDFSRISGFRTGDANGFMGRTQVAIGDVNGDGRADLVVSARYTNGTRVTGFTGQSLGATQSRDDAFTRFLLTGVYKPGLFLAAGDVNGDGHADLVLGTAGGVATRVEVLSGAALANGQRVVIATFAPAEGSKKTGVRVGVRDVTGDGVGDLLTSSGERMSGFAGGSSLPTSGPPDLLFSLDPDPTHTAPVWVG